MAERVQWRVAAKLLWAFEVGPPIDPLTQQPIKLDPYDYHEGLIHSPHPFPCVFKPRSEARVEVIRREHDAAMQLLAPYGP